MKNILVLAILSICTSLPAQWHIRGINADAKPKAFFMDTCFAKLSNDTLSLASSSNYILYPFGKIKGSADLKESPLKDFKVKNVSSEGHKFQMLTLNKNRLILCFDVIEEGTAQSYIVKGEIYDSTVNLQHKARVGMSFANFLSAFFDAYPKELLDRCKVIIFESCMPDTKHYYIFKNGKLSSVRFEPQGVSPFTIDYK